MGWIGSAMHWIRRVYWAFRYAWRAFWSIILDGTRFTDREMDTLHARIRKRVIRDVDDHLRKVIRDARDGEGLYPLDTASLLRQLAESRGGGDWEETMIKACDRAGDFSLDPVNTFMKGERTAELAQALVRMMRRREKGRREMKKLFDLTNESDSSRKSADSENGTEDEDVKEEEARRREAP